MNGLRLDVAQRAALAAQYLTSATDPANEDLPYWYLALSEDPAYARHCRVDDAELVGSWGEGLLYAGRIAGGMTPEQDRILANWDRVLLRGFRESGLRYNLDYPWAQTVFCNFHEQGWVLSALVARAALTGDAACRDQADRMVTGLRKTAYERIEKTYWGGTYPQDIKSYYFLQDSLYEDGWEHHRWSGRGENELRNHVMVEPLMDWYLLTGNETALDLAEGLVNHTFYESRRIAYNGYFIGHVHSMLWITAGALKLARVTGNGDLRDRCKQIVDHVIGASSSFGWVPEYSGWHAPEDEHCETCCIKDLIECAFELIADGYDEYYDLIDRCVRNQLLENQVLETEFIHTDEERTDEVDRTYRGIRRMARGGFSGGAEPNNISLTRFRNIAGCCGATGPEALYLYWKNTATEDADGLTVNFWHTFQDDRVTLVTDYPEGDSLTVRPHRATSVSVRLPAHCSDRVEVFRGERRTPLQWHNGCVFCEDVSPDEDVRVKIDVPRRTRTETVMGRTITTDWVGNTVSRMRPEGSECPLYQRTGERKEATNVALRATK